MNAYITPRILPNIRRRLLVLLLTTSGLTGCGAIAPDAWDPDAADRARIALAEQFITTFYRWDAAALGQLMLPSDEASNALYYQAWAEAANYAIKTRRPCRRLPPPAPSVDSYVPIYVECRITVTDDFGQALKCAALPLPATTRRFFRRCSAGCRHSSPSYSLACAKTCLPAELSRQNVPAP